MKQNTKRALSLLAALSLLLGLLSACAPEAEAATMHLRRTEGSVRVFDGAGKDLKPADNLGLYNGYGVNTRGGSYAWIDLDEVKLTKMDQDSAIEIEKEGKHLTIKVKFGNLFFNVTEPLADDETLDIRTSTIVVGVRDCCGWVEVPEEGCVDIFLLEGMAECTAGEETVTVNAGEMARLQEDEPIEVKEFTSDEVKAFVKEEAEDAVEALPGGSGGDEEEESAPPFIDEDEPDGEHLDITSTVGDLTVNGESVKIYGDAETGDIIINSGDVEIYGNAVIKGITINQGSLRIYEGARVTSLLVNGGKVEMADYAMTFSLTVEDGYVSLRDNAEIIMFFTHNGGTIDDQR